MIVWISKALALAIHDRQLAEHGGGTGVREESLLDSALARPQQLFAYGDPPPDIAALAASLAFGLARNHPFVDGNKRTAHVCYRVFLALNDSELVASQEEKYIAMLRLAEGSLGEAEFAEWLRKHLVLKTETRVNEPKATYEK
ncbi:MAG: type II toxin-antitoxin system death-on-curing family toxin [Xanthomonadaceae bacterium]|nr:type II toxin-antitoxin system death-on-curing family toxin [Xanthomonadaceae bacterium]